MDTDRQTGAPGNDDAALPSMIDVRAWHMNCFQTFVSSSATGFQKNCNQIILRRYFSCVFLHCIHQFSVPFCLSCSGHTPFQQRNLGLHFFFGDLAKPIPCSWLFCLHLPTALLRAFAGSSRFSSSILEHNLPLLVRADSQVISTELSIFLYYKLYFLPSLLVKQNQNIPPIPSLLTPSNNLFLL